MTYKPEPIYVLRWWHRNRGDTLQTFYERDFKYFLIRLNDACDLRDAQPDWPLEVGYDHFEA